MKKEDFSEQSSYQEESWKQGKSKNIAQSLGNFKQELNDFKDSEIDGEVETQSKTKLIIIGVVGILVLLIVIIIAVIAIKGSGGVKEPDAEVPERYTDPEIIVSSMVGYDSTTIEELRNVGYTGTEIEKFELNQDDPQALIEIAKAKQDKALKERYAFLVNNIDDKSQLEFVKNTFYVNPLTKISGLEKTEDNEYLEPVTREVQENVDYWKVPLHGHQAFLKLKLKSGEIVFYQTSIGRYQTLRPSGNIVVIYNILDINGNTFVQDIREIESETPGLN